MISNVWTTSTYTTLQALLDYKHQVDTVLSEMIQYYGFRVSTICDENDCHIMLFLKISERTFQRELVIKYIFYTSKVMTFMYIVHKVEELRPQRQRA